MQYLLMIHDTEAQWQTMPEAEAGEIIGRYVALGESLGKAGKMLGGERLQPSHTATSVRVRDGETQLVDGPFAETKEQLGGYYLIEADDLDDAIKIAAQIPAAETGCIEVRPIWVME